MKKFPVLISIFCLIALNGCKNNDADPKTGDPTEAAKSARPQQEAIHIEQNSNSAWYEFEKNGTKVMRCLDIRGCEFNGKKYNAGTETVSWSAYCGDADAFDFVQDYVCDPQRSALRCAAPKQCSCQNELIGRGAICAAFSAPNKADDEGGDLSSDHADAPNDAVPNDEVTKGTCSTSDEMTNSCKAKKDALSKNYGSQFECHDVVHTTPIRDQNGLVCGTAEHYEAVFYCNDKNGCKTPDGRIFNYKMHDALEVRNGAVQNEVCPYYLVGKGDTTSETRCITGDCVWPDNYTFKTVPNDVYIFSKDEERRSKDYLKGFKPIKSVKGYADNYKNYATAVTATQPDTKTCFGGKLYCHGLNNAPVPVPEMRDGFECRLLKDNIAEWLCTAKNGCPCGETVTPQGGYCYENTSMCGGIVLYEDNNYKCQPSQTESMAECAGSDCKCGSQTCLTGQTCAFGKCYCGEETGEFSADSGWKCTSSGDAANDRKMICTKDEGCVLNARTCPRDSSYKNNQCVCGNDANPGAAFKCDLQKQQWICDADAGCTKYGINYNKGDAYEAPTCLDDMPMTENGCMCGNEVTAPGAICAKSNQYGYISVCSEPSGCHTRSSNCNYGEYIKDGNCIIPESTDGASAVSYWVEKTYQRALTAKLCSNDTCKCGTSTCKTGAYCMEGQCTNGIIAVERFDQTFRYEFSQAFDVDLQNDPVNAKKLIERMLFGDWRACQTQASPKGDAVWHISQHGDDIADYTCKFVVQDPAQPPSKRGLNTPKGNVIPTGLSCDKETDCMCGSWICDDSACSCYTRDGRLTCECADGNAIQMESTDVLNCSDTRVSTEQKSQYKCWNGIGFVCNNNDGCDCGKTKCDAGAVCMRPDECTQTVIRLKAE